MNPATADPALSAAIYGYRWLHRHGFMKPLEAARQLRKPVQFARFLRDWRTYQGLPGAERLRLIDSFPQLSDRTSTTAVERHYFHQSVWAAHRIARIAASFHVDVGSDHRMVALLTALTPVVFSDIRPLSSSIPGLVQVAASVTQLPYTTDSIRSLSCLHVAEHIGLGRYGDALDPLGTRKAAAELMRVLAPGGSLLFSLPVGWNRVEFNAHRILTPTEILTYFPDLRLNEFSVEDDQQRFHPNATPSDYDRADYACGMFWFMKPER